MVEGTCFLSVIPVRSEPSGKSEMVNQILFGERFKVLEVYKNWNKIQTIHDNYEGWVESNQISKIIKSQSLSSYQSDSIEESISSLLIHDLTATFTSKEGNLTLLYGSKISLIGNYLIIDSTKYSHSRGTIGETLKYSASNLVESAMKLMNAPYLWGGRTPFGIDCSGLIQIAFRMTGVDMPRDAWQQAQVEGTFIDLIAEAREGDIAFFDNDEGKIIHTGILTNRGTIINANGKVREDIIDHQGIFNRELGIYTHKLRFIKRFNENLICQKLGDYK